MFDLSTIFIRAQDAEGKWHSLSLIALLEQNLHAEIGKWVLLKVARFPAYIQVKFVADLVGLLESYGETIYRFSGFKEDTNAKST